eukprot:gnl/TRDRNA2_/TRDRNA2_119876_c0_seq1.p1 gnl/TRDRNA2_/TRDRNA2_119876_c0~~gnl/TRDRNA2_/TRDRNA2_119876_c0_seq1.p1  ORF type:complete len:209 (+),score=18.25 gnl/TRDRNA2_/TRDRNA2_119876_c0_seq1:45-629(+)
MKAAKKAYSRVHLPFGIALHFLCNWLPYGLVWPKIRKFESWIRSSMTSLLLENCFLHIGLRPLLESREKVMHHLHSYHAAIHNESFYNGHENWIRSLVPPGQFFNFDFKSHGWADLVAFLGREGPTADTPFPRVRVKSTSPQLMRLATDPEKCAIFLSFLLATIAVNYLFSLAATKLACRLRANLNKRRGVKHE